MKIDIIIILLAAALQVTPPAGTQPAHWNNFQYLGQTPPGDTPQVFAPGIISTENLELFSPAITADGTEIYWSRIDLPPEENWSKIMYVKYENGIWSEPEVASFSGFYPDYSPLFSRDGNKLYFASEREFIVWQSHRNISERKFIVSQLHRNINKSKWIKSVNYAVHVTWRCQDDWSVPACLTPPQSFHSSPVINEWVDNANICYLSLIGENEWDGRIYETLYREYHGLGDYIFTPFKNSPSHNYTPWIAGDGSFILFSSTRNPYRVDDGDLYICFRQKGNKWSDAIFLGDAVNTSACERSPSLSPDGKYLFFTRTTRNDDQDIFWVNAKIITELKNQYAPE
ncbi:MAG TPA: hypothetical protein PLP19_11270 [bacterium]|nr:hypothetical protein [bacterium]HPN44062.1 hypothetical protein [bacterium]